MKLKLGLSDDENGHTFMFTSPNAFAERETFKKELTNIVGANRAVQAVTPSAPPQSTPATPMGRSSRAQTTLTPNTASTSRAVSVASSGRGSPTAVGTPEDFAVRKKVLLKNAELARLHKELVMTGQITEVEFWEGREVRGSINFDLPGLIHLPVSSAYVTSRDIAGQSKERKVGADG